jgi:hypothetical protein
MPHLRTLLICLASLAALPTFAQTADDPLQSPACLSARQKLDDAPAARQGLTPQLRALRQRVADACLRAQADPPRPARLARPPEAVAPTLAPVPLMPAPPVLSVPTTPPAPPQPTQVMRCDDGGCWDSQGQRLNRSGHQLINPQGQFCAQQGTVLICR